MKLTRKQIEEWKLQAGSTTDGLIPWRIGALEFIFLCDMALRAAPGAEIADDRCPNCWRKKAHSADDCLDGKCPKWFAVRDSVAEDDCTLFNKAFFSPPAGQGATAVAEYPKYDLKCTVHEPPAAPEHDAGAEVSRRQIVFDWLMQDTNYWGGSEEVALVDELLEKLDAAQPAHGERERGIAEGLERAVRLCEEYPDLPGRGMQRLIRSLAPAKQPDAEGGQLICPRCKVDRLTQSCPGPTGNCPMVGVAQ